MKKYVLSTLLTCAYYLSGAQVGIITTVAGTGEFGYSGDGGPATNAKFSRVGALCFIDANNFLVSDGMNSVIRKVNTASGIVTAAIGTGVSGFDGDGGDAGSAKIGGSLGIWQDGNYLYFIDGSRVRRVDKTTNIITTVAGNGTAGDSGDGGPATNAQFDGATGCCVASDHLYIVDYLRNKVRRVDLASGIITTVAGTGIPGYTGNEGPATNATFRSPRDIAPDAAGNLYISDMYNHVIRKINTATGIITTIAGNATGGYSGDGGPATNAQLKEPMGIYIDAHNDLYIAERFQGVTRKVELATGKISTVAGSGTSGYDGDGGPATNAKLRCTDVYVDGGGNVYISDELNHRVRKVSSSVYVKDIHAVVDSKLHPNPTKGVFTVQATLPDADISVYNVAGTCVFQQKGTAKETEIDISRQPAGMYMVYVKCEGKVYVSKMVKE